MNLAKIQIAKELLDFSKDAYNKHKHKQGSAAAGPSSSYSYYPNQSYQYGYGPPNPCQCQCRQRGGGGGPMQFISSLKNSKQLKSIPQKLQGLAAMKHGGGHHGGGGGGGVKKILPQVLKGIKSKMY